MVSSERVYEFPVPDWNMPFTVIPDGAFCICYQSGCDLNGYGPYGFNTPNADNLIAMLADEAFYYQAATAEVLPVQTLGAMGVYIFDLSLHMRLEIFDYCKLRKKLMLLERYGKGLPSMISKPKILKVLESGQLVVGNSEMDVLEHILIRNNYAPEAGPSLILFGEKVKCKIKDFCNRSGVEYFSVDSIDRLNSW